VYTNEVKAAVEYYVLKGHSVINAGHLEARLNELGADGWRLVALTSAGDYVCVRALPTQRLRSQQPASSWLYRLTYRQREVAKLVAEGKSNRMIARELQLREQTVKNLVSVTMARIEVTNRTELALKYLDCMGSNDSPTNAR
jgi:DNA-binding NarL/FixJ family response regulator